MLISIKQCQCIKDMGDLPREERPSFFLSICVPAFDEKTLSYEVCSLGCLEELISKLRQDFLEEAKRLEERIKRIENEWP